MHSILYFWLFSTFKGIILAARYIIIRLLFPLKMFCSSGKFRNQNDTDFATKVTISTIIHLKERNNSCSNLNENKICTRCVRCNEAMVESKSIFVMIHPALKNPTFSPSNTAIGHVQEACCCHCGISKSLRCGCATDEHDQDFTNKSFNNDMLSPSCVFKDSCYCTTSNSEPISNQCKNFCPTNCKCHSALQKRNSTRPCTDCHIAFVHDGVDPNCEKGIFLMLQVADTTMPSQSISCQTDDNHFKSSVVTDLDTDTQHVSSRLLTNVTDGQKEDLPASGGEYETQLPEFNEENEAAYQSHLKNLVPCEYCGRRFNPDRVMVHEKACIEKPKKKQYIIPDKDKKK